jgi:hypothetical protein
MLRAKGTVIQSKQFLTFSRHIFAYFISTYLRYTYSIPVVIPRAGHPIMYLLYTVLYSNIVRDLFV